MKNLLFFFFSVAIPAICYCQKTDTIIISASKVNTKVLIPGVHRYLVYVKNGKDSSRKNFQIWSRKIDLIQYQGRDAISVTQEWEDNDTIFHKVYSVCDMRTFAPLYQEGWWKNSGSSVFDFVSKKAIFRGVALHESDTVIERKKRFAAFQSAMEQYVLNWHLDLEVFSILPYKLNTTFLINFYDPGFPTPQPVKVPYTVIGSGELTDYGNNKIDCWLLQQKGNMSREVFWISKKTKEVLKLEQEFNGRFRYKIKLGFST